MKAFSPKTNAQPAALLAILLASAAIQITPAQTTAATAPNFGPNVLIFDNTMSSTTIQNALTAISKEDQFSPNRHAVLFKPGAYNIQAPVGYYESIAGLGASPNAVTINGFLTPNFGTTQQYFPGTNLTDTFWRSLENMAITPAQNVAQNAAPATLQWGVSQGAPLRRLQINGNLQLTDSYCGNASGGFLADLVVTGNVNPCSQQQWYSRGSTFGSWNGGVWNMVFSGVQGAPAQTFPNPPETVLATTPASREKPFLYLDSQGRYTVFAPSVAHNTTGTSWAAGGTPGRAIPISRFLIALPTTPIQQINTALHDGMNLLLTPGVYQLSQAIRVTHPNTVILGLGYATLVPTNGTPAITVADVDGVQIAGLIIDAGPTTSNTLVRLGDPRVEGSNTARHPNNPTTLSDITLRIAGATAGAALNSLVVNSNDVILDNIWAWRADHGTGAGWTQNIANHGLVVNGNNVLATGLAVEHYQQSQVQWNGNGGQTIFFQSELPYDVPSQAAWKDGSANGYPAYVVAPHVQTHTASGLGVYSFFNLGLPIIEDNAITVPTASGISVHDAGTVFLSPTQGSGQITHIINNTGNISNKSNADQLQPVVVYP